MSTGRDPTSHPRRRLTRTLNGVALTAVVALLAACSASDIDGPVITVTGSFDSTAEGMLTTVELENGCLRAADSVLVWPEDTTWDGETDEVIRADGTRIAMGTEITINSYALPDLDQILGSDGSDAAEACGGVSTPTGERTSGGFAVRVA